MPIPKLSILPSFTSSNLVCRPSRRRRGPRHPSASRIVTVIIMVGNDCKCQHSFMPCCYSWLGGEAVEQSLSASLVPSGRREITLGLLGFKDVLRCTHTAAYRSPSSLLPCGFGSPI